MNSGLHLVTYIRYCLDATSHSRGQHSRVCGIIYARDQAKFFESSEFARELTQPSKHFFFSSNNAATLEGIVEQLPLNT